MATSPTRVLLVEDNPADVVLLNIALAADALTSFEVTPADRLSTALELLINRPFDVILLDLGLPDTQGLETFTRLHQAHPHTPTVILSGLLDEALALQAVQAGAQDYLVKGLSSRDTLPRAVRYAIERKRGEESLRESAERLRLAHKATNDVVWDWDVVQDTQQWNEAGATVFGWTDIVAAPQTADWWIDRVHPDDRQRVEQSFFAVVDDPEKNSWQDDYRFRKADGSYAQVMDRGYVLRNAEGKAIRMIGAMLDITARKRAEDALRESEARYRLISENAADVIWVLDPVAGRFTYVSPSVEKLRGYTPAEVMAQPIAEALTPKSGALVGALLAQNLQAFLAQGSGTASFVTEVDQPHKDGSIVHTEATTTYVLNERGQVEIVGVSRDITERKRAEAALKASEQRWRALIANIGDGIELIDAGGQVFYASPSAARIMGYASAELIGPITGLIHPEDVAAAQASFAVVLGSPGQPIDRTYRVRHANGTWRWLEGTTMNLLADPAVGGIVVNFRDVTERKQGELALRESEEKYRGLMESLDSVVAAVDYDGRFLYMNDVAAEQLGGAAQELIGKTMHELFPEPVAARQLQNVRRVVQTDGGTVSESVSMVRGQPRWYRTMLQPIHDAQGRVAYVLINSTDIHDLKITQQELMELNRTLEERVRARTAQVQDLYDNAPMGYHSLDANGRLVMVNQTELSWLGYAREEMVGRSIADFLAPASRSSFQTSFPKLKQDGEVRDVELEMVRKDGTRLPVLLNSSALYDERGSFMMSRSSLLDITARKKAEDALRESEEQNRLLFDAAPDAMILFDESGRMRRVNVAFERLTGYRAEQVTGYLLSEMALMTREEAIRVRATIEQDLASKRVAAVEFQLTRANGEPRAISARAFGVPIGSRQYILLTLRDVTAEKQAAETLRQANVELARAVRAKDEFLANMSHELRTPLSAILLFTENLLAQIRGPLNERQQAALRNIEASGRHLLALINDILDLSKVEAGRLELQRETVAITEVCQASLVFVREAASKKALRLGFQLNDQLAQMSADPRRLKQMLVNLLSNAVKFTPAGGQVDLEVAVDAAAGVVRFAVQDTGIGIAAADLGRLFRPFTQLDAGLSRQYEGSGLGLALVHRLAELHGGSVAVESALGRGSRFTIALPYQPAEPADPPDAPLPGAATNGAAVAAGVCILLAEDNEANSRGMGEYLQDRGYDVVVARNGQEALGMAVARRPALILMDIQMPTMDGLEATRRLRGLPEFAATPIIALTALVMPGDRERCLAAGANDYLTKPVSLKGLVETMQKWLGKPES